MDKISYINELLNAYDVVVSLHLDFDFEHFAQYHLTLKLAEGIALGSNGITLKFLAVSNLDLSSFGGNINYLTDYQLYPIDDGLERIRYQLMNTAFMAVFFDCYGVELISTDDKLAYLPIKDTISF